MLILVLLPHSNHSRLSISYNMSGGSNSRSNSSNSRIGTSQLIAAKEAFLLIMGIMCGSIFVGAQHAAADSQQEQASAGDYEYEYRHRNHHREPASYFNYEVERRIQDQLLDFLAPPQEINGFLKELREKGGFKSGRLGPSDRDLYLKLITSFPSNLIVFSSEDGHEMGYDNGYHFAIYREPGNSGYSVDDPAFEKHLKSCIEPRSGEPVDCILEPGRNYIRFYECEDDIDNDNDNDNEGGCDLYEPCPDMDSQTLDCETPEGLETAGGISKESCLQRKKWCRKYTIETAQHLHVSDNTTTTTTGLGYIPSSYFCYNELAEVTQTPGDAFATDGSGEPGNTCVYEDGKTPVQRELVGEYAYCGGNGAVCNDTFTGAFYSPEFDARYRPWYRDAKDRQTPHWSDPYLYETGYIGLTHVHPIYTPTERGQVFDGVLAVDYKFEDFTTFLVDNYQDTDTFVAIYEDAEPHYLIGMSTGTQASAQYLASDPTQLCPTTVQYDSKDCVSERRAIVDIGSSREDEAIKQAFYLQKEAGYPEELLFVKDSDDVGATGIFVCQATLFEPSQGTANLKWRILTVSSATEASDDTIVPGDTFFVIMIIIGLAGVGVCAFFWTYLYSKRQVRAVAFADWRFTCAFVFGCGLLNSGTFTLLGENTKTTCLLRMWFFHLFFVVALAPLFVKLWRMYRLTQASFRRTTITNTQAALYTLPPIVAQVIILLVFTFVDPPKPTEIIEADEAGFTRHIVCESETDAFFIVQIVLEAGMVVVGCVLAYLQRNMDDQFGEAKQMLLAMYNIALVGTILLVVHSVADMDGSGKKILQAIGVLWGSVMSAAAFVVPRMFQVQHEGHDLPRRSAVVGVSGAFSPEESTTNNNTE